jgi:NADP-dependent 3-hydroxy acid dehydrogenase YdfG
MTNGHDLTGRTAVVTGASSGIGAATVTALAAAGARVALLARRTDRIEELAAEVGGLAVPADVTDPGSLAAAAGAVRAALGPVDLVVANAGVMLAAPFGTADPAEWRQMLDTNVDGLLGTGRAFLGDLLAAADAGRPADLIHIGSVAGHEHFPGYVWYSATKAAVTMATRGLRKEFGPRGLRVRVIEPGFTTSELGAGMKDTGHRTALDGMRRELEPLPAADIAGLVVWTAAAPARLNVAELVAVPTVQG